MGRDILRWSQEALLSPVQMAPREKGKGEGERMEKERGRERERCSLNSFKISYFLTKSL